MSSSIWRKETMIKRFPSLFAGHPVECWQHAVGAINRLPRRPADAALMVVPFWLLDLDFVGFGKRQAGSSRRGGYEPTRDTLGHSHPRRRPPGLRAQIW